METVDSKFALLFLVYKYIEEKEVTFLGFFSQNLYLFQFKESRLLFSAFQKLIYRF